MQIDNSRRWYTRPMAKTVTLASLSLLGATLSANPNAFQLTGGSTVSVFNTSSFQETGVVGYAKGAVSRLVVSPDNASLFLGGGGTPVQASVSTGLVTQAFNLTYPSWPPVVGPMAVSPDAKTLFVSSGFDFPEVMFVDVASGQVTATIVDTSVSETYAGGLQISADGKTLLMMNSPYKVERGSITVIDVPSQTLRGHIFPAASLYGPGVITPDGKHVYAITGDSIPSDISEFDVETGKTLATIAVQAVDLAISRDGSTLYAAGNSLYIIATATNQVTAQMPLPAGIDAPYALLAVNPVQPAAYYAYASTSGYSSLAVIDLSTLMITNTFTLPGSPASMGVSPDGNSLYVGNGSPNLVSALDYTTDRLVGAIEIPGRPLTGPPTTHSAVVSPDGRTLFLVFDNYSPLQPGLAAVDATTLRVTNSISLTGRLPGSIALSPDGLTLYVVTYSSTNPGTDILVFEAASLQPKTVLPVIGVDDLLVSRDGKFLFVARTGYMEKVDAASGQIVAAFLLPNGLQENSMVVSPSGNTLYVGTFSTSAVSLPIEAIATDSFTLTASLPYCATNLALSPDGTTLYGDGCISQSTDVVNVIDLTTGMLSDTLDVPLTYTNLSLSPDGKQLWVAGESNANSLSKGIIGIGLKARRANVIYTFSNGMVAFAPLPLTNASM